MTPGECVAADVFVEVVGKKGNVLGKKVDDDGDEAAMRFVTAIPVGSLWKMVGTASNKGGASFGSVASRSARMRVECSSARERL